MIRSPSAAGVAKIDEETVGSYILNMNKEIQDIADSFYSAVRTIAHRDNKVSSEYALAYFTPGAAPSMATVARKFGVCRERIRQCVSIFCRTHFEEILPYISAVMPFVPAQNMRHFEILVGDPGLANHVVDFIHHAKLTELFSDSIQFNTACRAANSALTADQWKRVRKMLRVRVCPLNELESALLLGMTPDQWEMALAAYSSVGVRDGHAFIIDKSLSSSMANIIHGLRMFGETATGNQINMVYRRIMRYSLSEKIDVDPVRYLQMLGFITPEGEDVYRLSVEVPLARGLMARLIEATENGPIKFMDLLKSSGARPNSLYQMIMATGVFGVLNSGNVYRREPPKEGSGRAPRSHHDRLSHVENVEEGRYVMTRKIRGLMAEGVFPVRLPIQLMRVIRAGGPSREITFRCNGKSRKSTIDLIGSLTPDVICFLRDNGLKPGDTLQFDFDLANRTCEVTVASPVKKAA